MPIFPKINGLNHVSFFPAIHIASIFGQIEVVDILIKAGADLNVTSAPYNFTALHSVMAILNELSNDISTNDEEDDGYVRIIMSKHIMAP